MYEYVVRGPEFHLNGHEYVRGERVVGADVAAVEADPGLLRRVVRVPAEVKVVPAPETRFVPAPAAEPKA